MPIYFAITLEVFTDYTTQVGEQIKQAIADYINSLTIGDDVLLSRSYSPANLDVVSGGNAKHYDINALTIGKEAGRWQRVSRSRSTNLPPVVRQILRSR